MKTVKDTNTGMVKRVSDDEAFRLVNLKLSPFKYVPKACWKEWRK